MEVFLAGLTIQQTVRVEASLPRRVFEFDQTRLRPKVEAALKAVQDRLFEVRFDPTDRRELMQLEDAKRKIMSLAKHELQT